MSKVSSLFVGRAVRIGLLALATALVLVPTIARARQHVEHRDSTRLSIKHSWVGVAPPTKASISSVAAYQAAVLPPPIVEIGRGPFVARVDPARSRAPRIVDTLPFDSPRGPPSPIA
jgi:hypothetical protein